MKFNQVKELSPKTIKRIGFIFLLFLFQKNLLNKYYPVIVRFNFIADLKPGTDIKFIGGPEIGYVRKIKRHANKVEVILKIKKNFKLRKLAEISIFTHGMMGERYVEISQTPRSGDYVKPGDTLIGNDALSFEIFQQNLTRLQMDMDYFKPWNRKTPENFKIILMKLQNNLNYFSQIIKKIRPLARTNIKSYKESINTIMASLNRAKKYTTKLKKDLKSVKKDDIKNFLSFFFELEKQMKNLNTSMENLLKTTKTFEYETDTIIKRENIAGKLIYDDDHYDKLMDKIEELEEFTEDIADNPEELLFR